MIFRSTIGKKMIVAISGLLMSGFLLTHLSINLTIFSNDRGKSFNHISSILSHNLAIKTIEIGIAAIFIIHIAQSLSLEWQNHQGRIKVDRVTPQQDSTWYSRSMFYLGAIVLLFLILHLTQFWLPDLFNDSGNSDLYAIVKQAFSQPWIVAIYVISCLALSFHLLHGLQSAMTTIGLMPDLYRYPIRSIGFVSAILIPLGFAIMPIAMYLDLIK